ncbi:dehydrogenase of unknown specificity, short-chain alcohol dehydrogenase like [Spongiibacter sp. IMCC21906]|uniref:SDR family NAD(P)-dependent oxidoreductase n=1 Tax=Spongiibacter sp. IMCC21906 TaxID=1620392 RepID=UPI00062DD3A8|nr:SDR family oxidoreductase [Spongiibacter sp. IMCC21906]AKH67850.1 dehydrogenase of unknown specificity, short-chain alcohol dehydrogenase like [Spongiibacter sp. IMCC21906]
MKNAVVITGTNGGIGRALKEKFSAQGYAVIGIGLSADKASCEEYFQVDFDHLAKNDDLQCQAKAWLADVLSNYKLKGLINNSAVQILAPLSELGVHSFQVSLNVNVVVPFFLAKICAENLKLNKGAILNIGSIHSGLTKKQFVAYATSKGALETMTKAMAVDLAGEVRVNMISPAAIETEMLVDGFKDAPEKYEELAACHPAGVLGRPSEVADIAYFVIEQAGPFLNGSIIDISGGISGKLHDPA